MAHLKKAVAHRLVAVALDVAVVVAALERGRDGVALGLEAALVQVELGDPPRVRIVEVELDRVDRLQRVDRAVNILAHAERRRLAQHLRA